ncbi:MAG: transcription termination/antitermination NusG family protein, partial [Opitutaceae bacterium]
MPAQTSAPPGAQWFALHTLSGQENKVKIYIERFKKAEELDEYIFEVLLPTEVVSEVKGGKKSTKVRKLYPTDDRPDFHAHRRPVVRPS